MEFVRGNLALRDHAENGEDIHLFEQEPGGLRYQGQASRLPRPLRSATSTGERRLEGLRAQTRRRQLRRLRAVGAVPNNSRPTVPRAPSHSQTLRRRPRRLSPRHRALPNLPPPRPSRRGRLNLQRAVKRQAQSDRNGLVGAGRERTPGRCNATRPRVHATPLSRPRLLALSDMARSVSTRLLVAGARRVERLPDRASATTLRSRRARVSALTAGSKSRVRDRWRAPRPRPRQSV
jgi:hypothetical protein